MLLPMVIVLHAQLYLVNKCSLLVMISTLCLDHQTSLAYQMANGVVQYQHVKVRYKCDESTQGCCVHDELGPCPSVTAPAHGTCFPKECEGFATDTIQFNCLDGYTLKGVNSLTCLSNATWNGLAPECRRT